jgi:hypothetical protein
MINYYINLSETILEKVKSGEDTSSLRKELYYIGINSFKSKVDTDELKVNFWVNIYEAYFLIMLQENIELKKIFRIKRIKFSNCLLSLNDIEFGILRKSKLRQFLWNFYNLFSPSFINKIAVRNIDAVSNIILNKSMVRHVVSAKS